MYIYISISLRCYKYNIQFYLLNIRYYRFSDIEFASAILNQVVGYVIFKIRGSPHLQI